LTSISYAMLTASTARVVRVSITQSTTNSRDVGGCLFNLVCNQPILLPTLSAITLGYLSYSVTFVALYVPVDLVSVD
jgi:hypothetical protein